MFGFKQHNELRKHPEQAYQACFVLCWPFSSPVSLWRGSRDREGSGGATQVHASSRKCTHVHGSRHDEVPRKLHTQDSRHGRAHASSRMFTQVHTSPRASMQVHASSRTFTHVHATPGCRWGPRPICRVGTQIRKASSLHKLVEHMQKSRMLRKMTKTWQNGAWHVFPFPSKGMA